MVIMARLWMVGCLLLLACDGDANKAIEPVGPPPPPPPASHEWKTETRLDGLLPAGAVPVGVAVDSSGRRFVLDRRTGLHELTATAAKLVVGTTELAASAGLGLEIELTDVAAFAPDEFVFTAENEGFVFDVRTRILSDRFCYLPSPTAPPPDDAAPTASQRLRMQGIPVKERTEAVAYSPTFGWLFAQPRTVRMDTGAVAGAELFMFRLAEEQPFQTRTIPDEGFLAGGMVASGQQLLLGVHGRIYRMNAFSDPTLLRAFEAPVEITGMARDLDGDLLVLDGAGRRLLKISEN
jgi:hypothetical protein